MSGAVVHRKLRFGPFEVSIGERVLRRDGQVLPLGGRALDILNYLADRPGEVIPKQELIDHVWSDVTVEEGSLRVHVAAIRKALGDGQFGNRYIANIKARGYSFVGTVVPLAGSTESRNDKFRHQGRLPGRPLMMIGRETVVGEVSDKLRDERFVTLLGPGGIGKTTIALAVGRAAAEEFGGKVHFVDLESLTDPRHVAGAVATSLGLPLKSKDPGLELVDLVRSRKLLIILDSCEHVIETVALLAEQLYQETEQVYLLTTSRELLNVEGEHCCRVRAYHSFSREVEASNTPTIRRLIPSCRHQLSRIVPRWSAGSRMRQAMAHRDPSSPTPMPMILRYGIAVLSVAIAIGLGFFLLQYFEAKLTPFLFAVAATVWYAGSGPSVLAIVLSVLSLNYFFLRPSFSFSPISYADLVYLTFCIFCALAVGWVRAVRRRTEQELRQAHEELEAKVVERTANLQRDEAYLAQAQKLTHTGSWAWDPRTGKVLYCSEEMFRIFGLDPRESLPSRDNFRQQIHPEDRDWVKKRFEGSLRERVDTFAEYRALLPDGTVRHISASGHPVLNENGELIEFIGTATDVTERKRLEERLRVQHTVAQVLAEAATIEEATPRILRAMGECLGWDVGALWRVDREAEALRCVELWHKASIEVPEFERVSREFTFVPGLGLPGRVWSSLEPEYIPDVV